MRQALDLNPIDAVHPQLSALPTGTENGRASTTSISPSQAEKCDTTTIGVKICGMVILATQDLDGMLENVIQLEWVTDSIFVARSGDASRSSEIIQRVRQMCEDTPPPSFEEVVSMFVNESNEGLGTNVDATNVNNITFMVGGRLHREELCQLFLVKRNSKQNPSLYVSISGSLLFAPASCIMNFFTDDIKAKLLQAQKNYDRVLLSEVVKELLADTCANNKTSKGRITMVTVDERGFHVFESSEYDDRKRGYKASKINGFYPVGYQTREA